MSNTEFKFHEFLGVSILIMHGEFSHKELEFIFILEIFLVK